MSNRENAEKKGLGSFRPEQGSKRQRELAEEVYRRYSRLVHYFLHTFDLPDRNYYDLFNQIFVKIVKGLAKMKHGKNMKSWVITIARNQIYDYYSQQKKEAKIFVLDSKLGEDDKIIKRFSSSMFPAEEEICQKQLRAAFQKCLSELDEKIRQPFLLRYESLLRWKEVAEILGLSVNLARNRAMQAQRKVIQRLKGILKFNKLHEDDGE